MIGCMTNYEWAHTEAKRRARSDREAVNVYQKGDDYYVRIAAATAPGCGFKLHATYQADGSVRLFGASHD